MVRKTGDWTKAKRIARKLQKRMDNAASKTVARMALEAERMAVKLLADQPSDWDPLSEKYKKQKEKRGQSEKILIATSTYFQSITSFNVSSFIAFAGVKRSAKGEDGQIVADIAAIHEYGSKKRNIPARPLWTKVYKEMEGRPDISATALGEEVLKFKL